MAMPTGVGGTTVAGFNTMVLSPNRPLMIPGTHVGDVVVPSAMSTSSCATRTEDCG